MFIDVKEDFVVAKGHWLFEFLDAEGNVVEQHEQDNLITTNGKALVLDLLAGINSATKLTGMAVGTSSTAAAIGDSAITGAVFKVFDAAPTRSGLTTTYITTYLTTEANINIQEVGMLTGSGLILFNRLAPVGPFNKTSAVALRITVTLTQA